MTLHEILRHLELIEGELDDNNIDGAKNELYCLKDDLERVILEHKKDEDLLYNRSSKWFGYQDLWL